MSHYGKKKKRGRWRGSGMRLTTTGKALAVGHRGRTLGFGGASLTRWLLFAAIVVVLAWWPGRLAVATVARRSRDIGPVDSGRADRPVEVLRDTYGVPHIYADNPEDLFEAQGYVHAQDRFFEMDFRRHIAAGRLSELFGASQVETDAYIRTLGWRRVAEQELPLLAPSPAVTSMRTPRRERLLQTARPVTSRWSTACSASKDSTTRPSPRPRRLGGVVKAMAWDLECQLQRGDRTGPDDRAGR